MLLVAACGPAATAPTASPSPAQMLARINGYDSEHMDIETDQAAAAREFDRILDCVVAAYAGEETEASVGDVIYRGWVASGKRETLLAFARAFC